MNQKERLTIHQELKRLDAKNRLTPDEVIKLAQGTTGPLHDYFDWDIEHAALQYWRAQARVLIGSFEIGLTIHKHEYRIQEFVENPFKRHPKAQGYVHFTKLQTNREMARAFISEQLQIAATVVKRTHEQAICLGLERETRTLVRELESLKERVQMIA